MISSCNTFVDRRDHVQYLQFDNDISCSVDFMRKQIMTQLFLLSIL